MAENESPRTVFEVLYTRFEQAPLSFCYDNGCNSMNYCLGRESKYFKGTKFLVDEAHFRGHKNCSPVFNTGLYGHVRNSPLAEQKNSFLRLLENSCGLMNQTTFLWYVRLFLRGLNRTEEKAAVGKCFWRKPA